MLVSILLPTLVSEPIKSSVGPRRALIVDYLKVCILSNSSASWVAWLLSTLLVA